MGSSRTELRRDSSSSPKPWQAGPPETDLEKGRQVAERIRGTVGAKEFSVEGRRLSVTVSVGVAVMDDSISGVAEFFHLADEKLYEAKHQGRNLVVT